MASKGGRPRTKEGAKARVNKTFSVPGKEEDIYYRVMDELAKLNISMSQFIWDKIKKTDKEFTKPDDESKDE